MDLNKIQIYLQPIKKLATGSSNSAEYKFEALMRYPDKEGVMKFPAELLSKLDEDTKFQVTVAVMRQVLDLLTKNNELAVSVNLSFDDIKKEDFRNTLLELIDESKVGERLTLEFIEEQELKDKKIITDFMSQAKKLGCRFALDDFGKGYATFDPLLSYDFDIVKLDEVLVKGFTSDPKRFFIVEMLVDMCKRLQIETVVEHIETKEMFNSVKFIGCTYAQGFYESLGEPELPEEWLTKS